MAEKAQDELSQANEQLRVDVEKWHEAKNKEVCQFMRQFANNHMEYHQKVLHSPGFNVHMLYTENGEDHRGNGFSYVTGGHLEVLPPPA